MNMFTEKLLQIKVAKQHSASSLLEHKLHYSIIAGYS